MLKKTPPNPQKNKSVLLYYMQKSDRQDLYMYSTRSRHSHQRDDSILPFFPKCKQDSVHEEALGAELKISSSVIKVQ